MRLYNNDSEDNNLSEISKNVGNMTNKELICLYSLQLAILKNDDVGFIQDYSLNSDEHRNVCMYKVGDNWEVFMVEKGYICDKMIFDDCLLACMEMTELLVDNVKTIKNILYDFSENLKQNYTVSQLEMMVHQDYYITTKEERKSLVNSHSCSEHYYNLLKIKSRILKNI